jgi:phosphatidylglycerophosphate synthase
VIDTHLRLAKDRALEPVVARLPRVISPGLLTACSASIGVGAGVLAASGARWWSLVAWLAGRLFDGLDGAVARRTGRQSGLGGYLDLMGDAIVYAAIPLGIAASRGDVGVWAACAVLLASFYLNTLSWTLLAALAAGRGDDGAAPGAPTAVHMPAGLVEGAETIVLFSVMLAWPMQAAALFWSMAALVAVTIVQRVAWATRRLDRFSRPSVR